MNGYVCFYNGKRWECYASSMFDAKEKAVAYFKPPKSKQHMVRAVLAKWAAPQPEHDLKDVPCECCRYMTYHREHMGCIRAATPKAAPMSSINRLIAYSAAEKLRELGFAWDEEAEAWLNSAAPQAQDVERGEVLVTVSGFTGSGKSAIAGEIEILCRALGLQVDWPDGDPEKNMTHADWTAALEQYKPRVRIVERNVPHSVVKDQDK